MKYIHNLTGMSHSKVKIQKSTVIDQIMYSVLPVSLVLACTIDDRYAQTWERPHRC